MVTIPQLWMPIVLSAVAVFVVSSVIHMLLGYHKSDFEKLSDEEAVMDALRDFDLPPGDYIMPRAESGKDLKDPAFIERMNRGPVAIMTVWKPGPPNMTANLLQWFLYSILVSAVAAYVAGRALAPGAGYLEVFRLAGTVAFSGYALALLQNSIWYKRKWGSTLKNVFDGLVYGLVTAGVFGALWPTP